MSTSVGVEGGGSAIVNASTGYWGGTGSISVSLCTTGGCLGGSPTYVEHMKGWDII